MCSHGCQRVLISTAVSIPHEWDDVVVVIAACYYHMIGLDVARVDMRFTTMLVTRVDAGLAHGTLQYTR